MTGAVDLTSGEDRPGLIARYGQLLDAELPESERIDQMVDLLVEVFGVRGVAARRASGEGLKPGVAFVLDGVAYLVEPTWSARPLGQDGVEALARLAVARPGIRLCLLSMTGYEPNVGQDQQVVANSGMVLLDRLHFEAILCGLVGPSTVLADAGHHAVFDNQMYTSLTDLLLVAASGSEHPSFIAGDRLPAPWPLTVRAAQGIQVRHLFSGDHGWGEPLGFALATDDRALVTDAEGIVTVDLKRGNTAWFVALPGCRGAPLVAPDGSLLTLCGDAIVRWRNGVLAPVAGDLGDARTLLLGPGGEPWVLSGYGATLGTGTATLALTRVGRRPGEQYRYQVHFDADVQTAGWLGDLRFFLSAAGHSAVLDLARSTAVRREDWIETPHGSPGHLVVVDSQTVITASPDGGGVHATLYRTDVTTRTSTLIAEIATNRVHGLATTTDGGLILLGDVRGNDARVPHPVLIGVHATRGETRGGETARPATPMVGGQTVGAAALPESAGSALGSSGELTTASNAPETQPMEPYASVRLAAHGFRRDYALDPAPIASGGQAEVFGATHKATGMRVAFKRLHSHGPDDLARMRREVEAAQLFGGHPHVLSVLDFSPTYDWFVMPLAGATAQTLARELRNTLVLRGLVTAVGEALREPHQRGWIHRDLKPDNILQIDGPWVVSDWGLGRRPRGETTDPHRTHVGGRFGTEGFAAPELSIDAHTVGPQADIYSIGQIIGWALTGQWPRANVPLLPTAGPWRNVVKAATHLEPSDRPGTVDDLLALISRELDEPPEIPVNGGKRLQAALRAGDPTAARQLFDLAARHPGDYELYLEVLVKLDDDQTRSGVAANPSAAREIVQGVHDLHTGTAVTLEYGDVDLLVTWLLMVARHAEAIADWDLLEDTAESIFYLDHWDRWRVQADIRSWLASTSGHAAAVVATAFRRNPDIHAHFNDLRDDRRVDQRIRQALAASG